MSVLDHLQNIDRIIGYPQGRGSGILTVLEELDEDGTSIKDGLGTAPSPSFNGENAAPLYGTNTIKSSLGGELILFYTTECVFSNFHPAPIIVDGKDFISSEHYFMWAKAKTFKDEETAKEILSAGSFQQNPSLRKTLFSTVGKVLVEAAPRDRIWGIGMGTTNKNAADPKNWRGTNNLGRILTIIREHMISSKLYDQEL